MTTTSIDKPAQASVAHTECIRPQPTFRPNVDILELDDMFVVRADMPGTLAENVDIELGNGTLTIVGKVKDREPDSPRPCTREFGVGNFRRAFKVGEAIDTQRISADYKDGVLTVHLPKAEEDLPRKIAVKTT